jgi:type IV pilus assembly protein PilC
MPVFLWEVRTAKGEVRKGEQESPDEVTLRSQLRRKGFKDIRIKNKPQDLFEKVPFLQQRVKEKDIVVFCRQFSTMINAGLPIVQCLDMLSLQEPNKTFAKIIQKIKEDIEGGSTLSDAMSKHPKIFDELFINLISAGEAGGILDNILQRLSTYLEKAQRLKRKVKGAMTYPASVVVISIGVVTLLLVKVIPVFEKMFEGIGRALPAPTQFVVNLSRFTQHYFLYIIGVFVLIVISFIRFYRTKQGRVMVDRMLLQAPIFGPLLKKVAVAKFSRTLSTMMSSGVPIVEGLDIVSKTAGNKIIEDALLKTKRSISEGKTIAEPLQESGIFPPMVVQMIAVGENSGALDSMLAKIADFYDEEVDTAVSSMTALLEPIMMVFLGGLVGGMIIAMYLPIFQIAATI